jgi:hypothetical protein
MEDFDQQIHSMRQNDSVRHNESWSMPSQALLTPVKGPVLKTYSRNSVRLFLQENDNYVEILAVREGSGEAIRSVNVRYRIHPNILMTLNELEGVGSDDDSILAHLRNYLAPDGEDLTVTIRPERLLKGISMNNQEDASSRVFALFRDVKIAIRDARVEDYFLSERPRRNLNKVIASKVKPTILSEILLEQIELTDKSRTLRELYQLTLKISKWYDRLYGRDTTDSARQPPRSAYNNNGRDTPYRLKGTL